MPLIISWVSRVKVIIRVLSSSNSFNWIIFLGLPVLITIKFITPACSDLFTKLCEHPWEALLSSLAVLGCAILLLLDAFPLCKREVWSLLRQKFVRNWRGFRERNDG